LVFIYIVDTIIKKMPIQLFFEDFFIRKKLVSREIFLQHFFMNNYMFLIDIICEKLK